MPRLPRKFVVDPTEPGVYHSVNRCVRRAFLCGTDPLTGQCFEHRKAALQSRLEFLAAQLAVDILGFSVMSNHLHVVVRNRPDLVAGWSDEDVARRWWNLFPKRKTKQGAPAAPRDFELLIIIFNAERLAEIRRRLSDLSWFMRCLVEPIARQANREDACSGRYWQGRYFCQKILDETALAACLAYVDLNPVRAGIAATPEESQYTSVYERVQALRAVDAENPASATPTTDTAATGSRSEGSPLEQMQTAQAAFTQSKSQPRAAWLSPWELSAQNGNDPVPTARASNQGCLPITFAEYLPLLDWTGRQQRSDKRGTISAELVPILTRLLLDSEKWLKLIHNFWRQFRRAAGRPESLTKEAAKHGSRKMPGLGRSQEIFGPPPNQSTV